MKIAAIMSIVAILESIMHKFRAEQRCSDESNIRSSRNFSAEKIHQRNNQRTAYSRGEPPTERRHSERCNAERNYRFSERRVCGFIYWQVVQKFISRSAVVNFIEHHSVII